MAVFIEESLPLRLQRATPYNEVEKKEKFDKFYFNLHENNICCQLHNEAYHNGCVKNKE
jgi:hypothetical protein